jgi:hypothetical protein
MRSTRIGRADVEHDGVVGSQALSRSARSIADFGIRGDALQCALHISGSAVQKRDVHLDRQHFPSSTYAVQYDGPQEYKTSQS